MQWVISLALLPARSFRLLKELVSQHSGIWCIGVEKLVVIGLCSICLRGRAPPGQGFSSIQDL